MSLGSGRRFWATAAAVCVLAAAAGYGVNLWLTRPGPDAVNPAAVRALLATPLPDLDGQKLAVDNWRGRVVVVNFWATWCAPCREEIPEFVRMQERLGARGLQFVGVAIDVPEKVSAFAREFGINYPLLVGGLDTLALMREAGNRVGVLPFTLILDRQGNVVSRHPGGLSEVKLTPLVTPLF